VNYTMWPEEYKNNIQDYNAPQIVNDSPIIIRTYTIQSEQN
jgi:hypothetical protein